MSINYSNIDPFRQFVNDTLIKIWTKTGTNGNKYLPIMTFILALALWLFQCSETLFFVWKFPISVAVSNSK